MDTREAVLTLTHNQCFEQVYENRKKITENCHFYSREKSLYVAWACFRYVVTNFSKYSITGLGPRVERLCVVSLLRKHVSAIFSNSKACKNDNF